MSELDLAYASAATIAAAIRERKISAVEVTSAAIQRIETLDPLINAVVIRDFDRALRDAMRADNRRAQGAGLPLLGVPVTVKESFNVAGLATTWGLPPFRHVISDTDALAVTRLRNAGAIVLGKTNVPAALEDLQTYNSVYGTTNNPWDTTRTPGGSSGGSAAALAAGFGAASIGSDIAGSLRVPAHFSGVFAHKTSHGIAPARGHTMPLTPPLRFDRDLTVIGPMARSADDLELLLDLLTVHDPDIPGGVLQTTLPPARHQRIADFRVLIIHSHPVIPTSEEICQAIDRLAEHLSAAGAHVRRSSTLLPDLADNSQLYGRLLMSSIAAAYPPDRHAAASMDAKITLEDTDSTPFARALAEGVTLTHRDWLDVDTARTLERETWRLLFQNFDVVITPVTPTTALPHDHSPDQWTRAIDIDGNSHSYAAQLVWAGLASASGLPATAIPIDSGRTGLPIGVQLIGPLFEDRTPIALARWLERTYRGFTAPAIG